MAAKQSENQLPSRSPGKAEDRIKWLIDMKPLEGVTCTLETRDGVKRSGKITKVSTSSFLIGKRKMTIPIGFELNGDSGDVITFVSLVRLDVSEPRAA